MARTTKAAAAATPPAPPATPDEPSSTTLDEDTTKPSTTAPGDGPADTTDPTEIAVSVPAQPGAEALAVGTVNAVKPADPAPRAPRAGSGRKKDRIEEYEATKPDGTTVTIVRNIETGETSVK